MKNKLSLIIAVSVLSCSLVSAQNDNILKDWSIGFNYGMTQFDGDVRQYDYASSEQIGLNYQDSEFKELRSALSFSLEKKIDENLSLSIENISGEFAGLRRPNEYLGLTVYDPYEIAEGYLNIGYGDKFVTSFNETDVLLNYNVGSIRFLKKEIPENISIIVKMGFGYNVFRSLRTNLYTDDYVYSYGYDDLTKNESDDPVSESVFVAGAKLKYEFQKGMSLLLDYTVRVSNSDKWDSSIMEGGQGKDRFSFLSLGLAYDLVEINKTKEIIKAKD